VLVVGGGMKWMIEGSIVRGGWSCEEPLYISRLKLGMCILGVKGKISY
jgi:hypothetical protein